MPALAIRIGVDICSGMVSRTLRAKLCHFSALIRPPAVAGVAGTAAGPGVFRDAAASGCVMNFRIASCNASVCFKISAVGLNTQL